MKKGSSNKSLSNNGTSNESLSSKSSSNKNLGNEVSNKQCSNNEGLNNKYSSGKVLSKNGVSSNGLKNKGITLIALVISIIVILILAGVSLSATVGDNGVITKAQQASVAQKVASDLENLNMELTGINVDSIYSSDGSVSIPDIAQALLNNGTLDTIVKNASGNMVSLIDPETKEYTFYGTKGDNTYKIIRSNDNILTAELASQVTGGDITGSVALVTAENFNTEGDDVDRGKFTISENTEVIFVDNLSGDLSIYVPAGVSAKVSIYADMTLTNQNISRSAIDIESGATLDIYVAEGVNVTVNSGLGEDGENNVPGKGGYAGIHVPEGATLNIKGDGTVYAYGGDAGDGATFEGSSSYSGAGGGGAGAGIGGNGGKGGAGANGNSGSGENGESCGTVNVWNSAKVYAYGGGGGSGGKGTDYGQATGTSNKDGTAGAGGGYPGAGIGGGGAGGAGGSCCSGGGGYSGGTGEENKVDQGVNGGNGSYNSHQRSNFFQSTTIGFGYFSASTVDVTDNHSINNALAGVGGLGGTGCDSSHIAGNGGTAGSGGIVNASPNAMIYAYNGNRYTDGTSYNNGENQCPIYLQNGIVTAKYRHGNNSNWIKTTLVLTTGYSTVSKTGYVNTALTTTTLTINDTLHYTATDGTNVYFLKNIDMRNQGIGSGAGYKEVSNGTYNGNDASLQ
jgi:hypothetical protein